MVAPYVQNPDNPRLPKSRYVVEQSAPAGGH
jgi:hypothetical protein